MPDLESPYLSLLLQDAPAVDYDAPVARARADGASEEEIAAFERARVLALRVRATLHEQRRREAELAALFETASDLAGLRDLDAVLRAIVVRARKLLGTDVAYLTLTDPTAGEHLHAGDRGLGVGAIPAGAPGSRRRIGRSGRADRVAVCHRGLSQRRPVPPHPGH